MIKIEQLRKEVMLCMVEQEFFSFKVYEREMKKIDNMDVVCYGKLLKLKIHEIIRFKLDEIIGNDTLSGDDEQ
jgi:hypothetical protein